MIKKLICALIVMLVATIILAVVASAGQNQIRLTFIVPTEDAEADITRDEVFFANEREAIRQLEAIRRGHPRAADGSIIYPDFYAGSGLYRDGTIWLFIVEAKLEEALNHDIIGPILTDGAQHVLVEYSYAELRELQRIVFDIISERRTSGGRRNCRYAYNVSLGVVDIRYNRVTIGIVRYNEAMIAGFRRYVYDSPMIMFEQSGRISHGGGYGRFTFGLMALTMLSIVVIVITVIVVRRRVCTR